MNMHLFGTDEAYTREYMRLQLKAEPTYSVKQISKTRHYINKVKKLINNLFNKPKPYGLYNGPHGVRSTFVFAKIK